jgi:hypothetical protein
MITSTVEGTELAPTNAPMHAFGGVNVAFTPRRIAPHITAIMHVQSVLVRVQDFNCFWLAN